jgi:hypothetical protein
MQIHNYYSDLLLSIRSLFDNKVFRPNTIKHYDFNIANRAFAIDKDYKTQFEFPACIVTLNDDMYLFGERPNVIQMFGPENKMQHIALHNYDNDRQVIIQEEHVQTNISVIINCESQLQAKDLEFMVKRALPLNKYIQLLEFTSFLEIPYVYLKTLEFETQGHQILNLFTKLHDNPGQVDYCFSMSYRPHIRLESINATISDASTRSFPVNIELSYLTQMPMHLYCAQLPGEIEVINVHYSRFGHDPISDYPVQKVLSVFKDIALGKDLGSPIPKRITENGTWNIDPNAGALIWTDRFTNNSFEVASKPNDGVWNIIADKVVWERESDGIEYYLDEKKDTIRKGSDIGELYLKPNQPNLIFDKPKSYIRRTFIVSDEKDIVINKTDSKVLFCITFNAKDFVIKKGYRYNFIDNRGDVIRDYPYLSHDELLNRVCFEVKLDDWDFRWKPSLTTPLMIQFLEDSPSRESCGNLGINAA